MLNEFHFKEFRLTFNSKYGNTSIWGSLPNFSTGYFQVILNEVRSGQVRSGHDQRLRDI